MAWVSSVAAYAGSLSANTIDEEAIAAAVSPARSDPGQEASILYAGRAIGSTSAGPHQAWSVPPLPTCPYSTFGEGCALMK